MRGDIVRLRADPHARGHQQRVARYGVVVQSDYLALSTTLVVPTSTSALAQVFRPVVDVLGQSTTLMPEQLRTVRTETSSQPVGRLSYEQMNELDEALEAVLSLNRRR